MRIHGLVITSLLLCSDAAWSGDPDSFERIFQTVHERSCCGGHAVYDRELGYFFQAQTDLAPRLDRCLDANPGARAVKGYFDFAVDGSYEVVLRPAGRFASCLSAAFEGRAVPEPPTLPYANPFTFTTED